MYYISGLYRHSMAFLMLRVSNGYMWELRKTCTKNSYTYDAYGGNEYLEYGKNQKGIIEI